MSLLRRLRFFSSSASFWRRHSTSTAYGGGKVSGYAEKYGVPYDEAKRQLLDRTLLEFEKARGMEDKIGISPCGYCEKADAPEAGCEALVWIEPSSPKETRNIVVAEVGHAVTKKIQRLTGVPIRREVDEVLEYVHQMIQTPETERGFAFKRIIHQLPALSAAAQLFDRFEGHLTATGMFSSLFARFRDTESLRDLAVVLATTPNVCIGEVWAETTFSRFIDRTAEKEKAESGSLRKLAEEKRKLLAEREKA